MCPRVWLHKVQSQQRHLNEPEGPGEAPEQAEALPAETKTIKTPESAAPKKKSSEGSEKKESEVKNTIDSSINL